MAFNVGDKVRIVGSDNLDKHWNGVEGTVLKIVPGAPWPICVGNFTTSPDVADHIGECYLNPVELELIVEEPKHEPEPKAPVIDSSQLGQTVPRSYVEELREYLNTLINVYAIMEQQNRSIDQTYAAAIYKQVAADIRTATDTLDSILND